MRTTVFEYLNLQVRVAGWNIRWNDIPRKERMNTSPALSVWEDRRNIKSRSDLLRSFAKEDE